MSATDRHALLTTLEARFAEHMSRHAARQWSDVEARLRNHASALSSLFEMGITLLNEAQYRALQTFGAFNLKTSSWILTSPPIRALGGALFCDWRYDTVFTYHNGAQSYYGARGFRGVLRV